MNSTAHTPWFRSAVDPRLSLLQDWSPNDSARLRSIIASLQRGVSPEDRGSGGHEVLHEDVSSRGRAVDLHTRSLEKTGTFLRLPSFPDALPQGRPRVAPAPCPPIAPRAGARFFLEIWADNREPRTTSLVGHHSEPRSNNVVPTHEGPQLAQPRAEALLVSCAHF